MDFSGIARSVFLDVRCTNFHLSLARQEVSFASSTGRENEAANLLVMNMVLIDRD